MPMILSIDLWLIEEAFSSLDFTRKYVLNSFMVYQNYMNHILNEFYR